MSFISKVYLFELSLILKKKYTFGTVTYSKIAPLEPSLILKSLRFQTVTYSVKALTHGHLWRHSPSPSNMSVPSGEVSEQIEMGEVILEGTQPSHEGAQAEDLKEEDKKEKVDDIDLLKENVMQDLLVQEVIQGKRGRFMQFIVHLA